MKRTMPWAVLVLAVALALSDPAFGQEPTPAIPQAPQGDTFPAALGYAAIALAGTVWGGMSLVVRHLWKGLSDLSKSHQEALDAQALNHKTEVDGLRDRLEKEQRERREEVERLTKEQKDIFRETLVTSSEVGSALRDIKVFLNENWEEEGD